MIEIPTTQMTGKHLRTKMRLCLVIGLISLSLLKASEYPYVEMPVNSINPNDHIRAVTPGLFPGEGNPLPNTNQLPDIFVPQKPRMSFTTHPWKKNIKTTTFWVGEKPTPRNPTPNTASSWDTKWTESFGGYDNPDPKARDGYLPKNFIPKQNPFYVALPYNDITRTQTKWSAKKYVPWFNETFYREGRTVLKGRWIAIRFQHKICYGQWEDCGPFETDNYQYVFGNSRPRTKGNGGAGLDVSPAIRDFLGFPSSSICDWRFVELHEVPDGPWKKWGHNNPFAMRFDGDDHQSKETASDRLIKLKQLREIYFKTTETNKSQ